LIALRLLIPIIGVNGYSVSLAKKTIVKADQVEKKKFAEGDQINRNSLRTRVVLGFETFLLP
jgi:hypothetical protein